jgi:hypothetical protein
MIFLLIIAILYLYAGLLFAEVMVIAYRENNVHPNVERRHYPLLLFAWPIAVGIVVLTKHWRSK